MKGKRLKRVKKLALEEEPMYKFSRNSQITFSDFNQPLGMKMNANNRWVKKAEMIPWDKIEEKYAWRRGRIIR